MNDEACTITWHTRYSVGRPSVRKHYMGQSVTVGIVAPRYTWVWALVFTLPVIANSIFHFSLKNVATPDVLKTAKNVITWYWTVKAMVFSLRLDLLHRRKQKLVCLLSLLNGRLLNDTLWKCDLSLRDVWQLRVIMLDFSSFPWMVAVSTAKFFSLAFFLHVFPGASASACSFISIYICPQKHEGRVLGSAS